MSTKQNIQKYISENPSATNTDIAAIYKTPLGVVAGYRAEMKKIGLIPKHEGLTKECEAVGLPVEDVGNYWYKGKHYSIHVKANQVSYFDLQETIINEMIKYSPKYPVLKRKKPTNEYLLGVVDVADPHFGKYATKSETGNDYNIKKAEDRFFEGIEGLCAKLEKEKIEKIVYIGGNDRLHTDNPFRTTTAGTKQDTDGMWFEAYLSAKRCDVGAIERLLTIANVHFVHCPSNHDYMTGFMLADTIKSWFHNNKNITFDISNAHRKYMQFGNSLIGATHGDGAKEIDLSDLMKTEAKKAWSISKYAYWYVHHLHHKIRKVIKGSQVQQIEKDGRGLTILSTGNDIEPSDYAYVEYLRSLSGTDRWHDTNGFNHNLKAVELFLHHKQYGQIDRYSHLF